MLYFCVLFSCFMKLSFNVLCLCCVRVVGKKNDVLYFSACGTHTGILCCIFQRVERALVFCVIYFPHVERALEFCAIYFRLWNALWNFLLYIFACVTRSSILGYIFWVCNGLF